MHEATMMGALGAPPAAAAAAEEGGDGHEDDAISTHEQQQSSSLRIAIAGQAVTGRFLLAAVPEGVAQPPGVFLQWHASATQLSSRA